MRGAPAQSRKSGKPRSAHVGALYLCHLNGFLSLLMQCDASVAVSQQARLPIDQQVDSEERPPSSVLSGWSALGVVIQLALDQDVDTEERPPSDREYELLQPSPKRRNGIFDRPLL